MSGPDTPLYALGVPHVGTGTLAVTAGAGPVVGTGTAAGTDFKQGDVIIVNGQTLLVHVITNATHFTVTPNPVATASGLSFVVYDLNTTLLQRGIAFPKGVFLPYSTPVDLGDGGLRGAGWMQTEWQWGFLSRPMRDALRLLMDPSLAGLASAFVYIVTSQNEQGDVFVAYQGQMLWPQGETRDAERRKAFSVRFRALVELPLAF